MAESDHSSNLWPLSRTLFKGILDDRISDSFVCRLVWERLGYEQDELNQCCWIASDSTPRIWSDSFFEAPQVIAHRKASISLTRSIPKEYKQLLKTQMGFHGYKIGEIFPRRARRATAVNWLLAWLAQRGEDTPGQGLIPPLLDPPEDPTKGHPGDLDVE